MESSLPSCWSCKLINVLIKSRCKYLPCSFSPRKIMLFGMITQIFCGCVTGLVNDFSLHIFFRYLSAVCCAQMYTAGQMICKIDVSITFLLVVSNILIYFLFFAIFFLLSSVAIYFSCFISKSELKILKAFLIVLFSLRHHRWILSKIHYLFV